MRRLLVIGFSLPFLNCQIGKVWEGVGGSLQNAGRNGGGGSTAGAGGLGGLGSSSGATGATGGTGPGATGGTGPGSGNTSSLISPNAPGCAHGQVSTTLTPVQFMFTIDRSGSMNTVAAGATVSKWQALQGALEALFTEMGNAAAAGDNSVAVGVDYFSDDGTSDLAVEWQPAVLDQTYADTLVADIGSRSAGGKTPTLEALTLSYNALLSYQPTGALANGQKVEVLVSDGVPNPVPPANSIPDLVSGMLAGSPSILTFAVGVGELNDSGPDGYDPTFMSSVAYDGGTGPAGCDPTSTDPTLFCQFQVTPSVAGSNITAAFTAAFESIREQVASCSLVLNIGDAKDLAPGVVIVVEQTGNTQTILTQDPVNGWTFDNPTSPTLIQLHGQDCTALRANPGASVFAIVGCVCGTNTGPGASTGGEARDNGQEGGGSSSGGFNTNWCSYSSGTPPPCTAGQEGCP